jgi:hypothetical protein
MTFCNLMAKIGRTLRLVVCKVLVSGTIQVFIPNAITNCIQNDALKTMILANWPIRLLLRAKDGSISFVR